MQFAIHLEVLIAICNLGAAGWHSAKAAEQIALR
jgi:hypothetical protein